MAAAQLGPIAKDESRESAVARLCAMMREAGARGGRVGMCICNDRRWPETFRVIALQGVELIMLGYNTPLHYPPAPEHDHLQDFHNHLVMQAGAYQNGS